MTKIMRYCNKLNEYSTMKGLIFFLVIMTFIFAAVNTEAVDRSKIGGIFTIIENASAQDVTDSVEIMEFMSFSCGHCYRFSKKELILKGRYPHRINFKYIPIHWGDGTTKSSEAYLIAKDMGKGEKMRPLLFKAAFEQRKNISEIAILEELAASIGLGEEFNRKLRSGEKKAQALRNIELAREFSVGETPSFVIAGNLMVTPKMTGGHIEALVMNLDTVIGTLLEAGKKK